MTLEEKYQKKFSEGFTEGKAEGISEGMAAAQRNLIVTMHQNGVSAKDIVKFTEIPMTEIQIPLQSENATR